MEIETTPSAQTRRLIDDSQFACLRNIEVERQYQGLVMILFLSVGLGIGMVIGLLFGGAILLATQRRCAVAVDSKQ